MLKSDRWIRKMAQEHDMINPFSEKQVREGVVSYGLVFLRLRLARGRRVQDFYQRQLHRRRSQAFRRAVVRHRALRRFHRAAEFVCAGAVGRVLQDSARHA